LETNLKDYFKYIKITILSVLLTFPSFCHAQTTLDEIINDMILSHEGLPHGVPLSVDWSQKPRKGASEPGVGWTAAIAWGQVYEWANGSPVTNTRIQIKDLEMYYLSKSDHKWHLLQKALKVNGANYVEDFAGDVNKPANIRTESDGSISTTCGGGYNFHFWPSTGRTTIPVNDVAGCFTTVKARIILNDKNGIDDRINARYLMSVGGDWWLSLTAPWDNWKTNWDIGIGRFRFITPEWKSFNMYSVPADTMFNNPPPFLNVSTSVKSLTAGNSENIEIYPVPVNNICHIKFSIPNPAYVKLIAIDTNGKVVDNILNNNQTAGEHVITWNIENLQHGIYLVYMENGGNKAIVNKIIK
jgi:hypothetical protein